MIDIRMFRSALLATLTAILISACGTMGAQETALTAVHTKLLYEESEQAKAAMMAVDFGPAERAEIAGVIANLESHRQYLAKLHHQSGADILLTAVSARPVLDNIRGNYLQAREIYLSHIEDLGIEPDPILAQYDQSAKIAYDNVSRIIADGNATVASGLIVEYLGLALRVLAVVAV